MRTGACVKPHAARVGAGLKNMRASGNDKRTYFPKVPSPNVFPISYLPTFFTMVKRVPPRAVDRRRPSCARKSRKGGRGTS